MKLGSLAASRPAYYDRNATNTWSWYAADNSPHAPTSRVSITVAAGKKFMVDGAFVYIVVSTAQTVAGRNSLNIEVTDGTSYLPIARCENGGTSVVNQYFSGQGTLQTTVYAGQTIQGQSYMTGTGGTHYQFLSIKGTTFDA